MNKLPEHVGARQPWRRLVILARLGVLSLASLLTVGVTPAASAGTWTFAQVQRVNSLTLQASTDAFATQNAFGGAFVASMARDLFQSTIDASIADGSTSLLLQMRDLADLSGTNDPSFNVGVVNATPASPGPGNPVSYAGTSDLDWWYLPGASELEADGSAKYQLPASFTAKTLSAGPGAVRLATNLGGQAAILPMSNTRITAIAGNSSKPLLSTNGLPPGHLAEENLPDSLTSFESMNSGKLAGSIPARSLAEIRIPASLVGTTPCTEGYTISNTMLDFLVTGCRTLGIILQVRPTQPDTVDPAVGSGVYVFTKNVAHRVTGCTHNGTTASLDDCLDAAAYSIYFQFTTDRVIDQHLISVTDTKLLTVNRAGSGSGTVTSSPAGIDCGDDCTERFDSGPQITLNASPSDGSRFDGWTGCDNPSGMTCEMSMTADRAVAATFTGLAPLAQVTPAAIDFGSVTVGTTSAHRTVTITNTGDAGQTLAITAAVISGPNAADFAFASDACTTAGLLAGWSTCAIELTFSPSAAGARSASLTITDSAADSPQAVALTGIGGVASADLAVSISASPDPVKSGRKVTYTITVLNAGPAAAMGILLNDSLSSQSTFVSATTSLGTCVTPVKGASGVVSCSLGSISSETSTAVQIIVAVIAKKTSITNTVTVSATTLDPNLANNTASITTRVK